MKGVKSASRDDMYKPVTLKGNNRTTPAITSRTELGPSKNELGAVVKKQHQPQSVGQTPTDVVHHDSGDVPKAAPVTLDMKASDAQCIQKNEVFNPFQVKADAARKQSHLESAPLRQTLSNDVLKMRSKENEDRPSVDSYDVSEVRKFKPSSTMMESTSSIAHTTFPSNTASHPQTYESRATVPFNKGPVARPGEVSTNFVRLNLKRRGSYRQKGGNRSTRLKRARRQALENRGGDEREVECSGDSDDGKGQRHRKSHAVGSGLASIGLDPLQMALESGVSFSVPTSRRQESHGTVAPLNSPADAPLCTGHQMAAKAVKVKKAGPNKGRTFFACSYPRDQQCDFFMWAEDNPRVFEAMPAADTREKELSQKDPVDEFISHAVALYSRRLMDFDVAELKDEITKVNNRNNMRQEGYPSSSKVRRLLVSGRRQDMIERLSKAAYEHLSSGWAGFRQRAVSNSGSDTGDVNIGIDNKSFCSGNLAEDVISLSDSNESSSDYDDEGYDSTAMSSHSAVELSDSESEDSVCPKLSKVCTNDEPSAERVLRCCFGLSEFRPGQRWAIDRVLQGKRSLLVLPTGAGKSLCFLLPTVLTAAEYGITIVVSPLVALMRDQIRKLPVELTAGCFSGDISAVEVAELTTSVLRGFIRILFVSPERLCTPSFRNLISKLHGDRSDTSCDVLTRKGIGLLCVDEAHCLSQWSFNFRPSFLRIKQEVERIRPRSVLALTATAPPHVQHDIMNHLSIPPNEGLLSFPPGRANLNLRAISVLDDEDKLEKILKEIEGFVRCGTSTRRRCLPSIVYVWRRDESETVSEFLRSHGIQSRAYHAGLSSAEKNKVQVLFDKGSVDVVVATIAFGMGIDKSNVRLVIHASLPKSVESYLQEIGRAGRDGKEAQCVLLLNEADMVRSFSLSHSNYICLLQVVGLLRRVFIPLDDFDSSSCCDNSWQPPIVVQDRIALIINDVEKQLDLTGPQIETLISILELCPFSVLTLEESRCDTITGRFQVPKSSDEVKLNPILSAIVGINRKQEKAGWDSQYSGYEFEVSLAKLSHDLGMSLTATSHQLYQMQCRGFIVYTLSDMALHLRAHNRNGNLQDKGDFDLQSFEQWLWRIGEAVYEKTLDVCTRETRRTIDMWRLGNVIAQENMRCSDAPTGNTGPSDIMEFLCKYMTQLSTLEDVPRTKEASVADETQGTSVAVDLVSMFRAVNVPIAFGEDALVSGSPGFSWREQCCRQIRVLLMDPSIETACCEIYRAAESTYLDTCDSDASANNSTLEKLRQAQSACKSHFIMKVLHGIASDKLPSSAWHGRAEWAGWRNVSAGAVRRVVEVSMTH